MPHAFPLVERFKESPAALENIVRFVAAHTGWDVGGQQGGASASTKPASSQQVPEGSGNSENRRIA